MFSYSKPFLDSISHKFFSNRECLIRFWLVYVEYAFQVFSEQILQLELIWKISLRYIFLLKDKHLPITIATELADVSWIDFRPLANLQTPDPKDVESFGKKYESCLQSLLRMLEELMNHKRVVNLQGK